MQIYKVGGCVRDKLLGLPVNDHDFVVVGSTPEQMVSLGFKPVGRDFPVFLHPQTHEEYALARSEKKSGTGYHGFIFQTSPDITLEQDLKRRDITINAIAEDNDGTLIDPFGGTEDLKKKIIRHVSDAFVEDPLRVLRVARFSARFNFKVAESTLGMMQNITQSGELKTLSIERIWSEIHKALMSKYAGNFFTLLYEVGALQQIIPELVPLVCTPDLFDLFKTLARRLYEHDAILEKRFAVLCHFIRSVHTAEESAAFIHKAYINGKAKHIAGLLNTYYTPLRMLNQLSSNDIFSMINALDPQRRNERYVMFIDLCQMLAQGYDDIKTRNHIEVLKKIVDKINRIRYEQIRKDNPETFIDLIRTQKLKIIGEVIASFPES